ncbi:MAG: four helix bundle protein [Anaerohalosphaera sp.]|nr:four helix bundle protein [Anaerohalosphaera sp.]
MSQGGPARSFEDLMVWQKAHRFVLDIYKFTKAFPKDVDIIMLR